MEIGGQRAEGGGCQGDLQGAQVDVPVDIVFEDEGCGGWGGEEASQGVQVTEPGERGAAGDGRGSGGAEV